MKRPFFWAACWYALGIWAAARWALPWPWIAAWAWGLALVCLVWSSIRGAWLVPLLVCCGWARAAIVHSASPPTDVRHWAGRDPLWVTVRGQWLENVQPAQSPQSSPRGPLARGTLKLSARKCGAQAWRPARGIVLVTFEFDQPGLTRAGEMAEITGWLAQPAEAWAPGLFDEREYLRTRGVYYVLNASHVTLDWAGNGSDRHAVAGSFDFQTWARRALARGLPSEDDSLRLLWAMCLGWRTGLRGDVSEPFMQTGTMHVFAISGLHVMMVSCALIGFLRLWRLPRWVCGWMGIPLIWLYVAETGWQPSAVRSAVMASVVMAGWSLHRPGDLLNSLGCAAFLLLCWDPDQLFQLGFQLSFLVVLSLGLGGRPLQAWLDRVTRPRAPRPRRLRGSWTRRLDRWRKVLTGAVAVSLLAWLASAPWVAWHFHYFNPIALLANLFLMPLAGLAMGSALLSLATAAWAPPVSEWCNHGGWFWMTTMIWIARKGSEIPGAWYHVASPSGWSVVLSYALLWSACLGAWKRSGLQFIWGAGCLALLGLLGTQAWREHARTRLLIMPGPVVWYRGSSGADSVLIDTGDESAVKQRLLPRLHLDGVNDVTHLILTHGDRSHVAGAERFLSRYSPQAIWVSPVPFRSKAYRDLLDAWIGDARVRRTSPGLDIGDWTVLHPAEDDRYLRADDGAIVLWASLHGLKVLLISDLGADGQDALLNRYPSLRADVVVTGLASDGRTATDMFLQSLQARWLVVADEAYPAYDRADVALRDRLSRLDVKVLFTHQAHLVAWDWVRGKWTVWRGDEVSLP